MAGAIMNKVWDFLGVDTTEEMEEHENIYGNNFDEEIEDDEEVENKGFFNRKNKIVGMPQSQQVRMVITQPTNFDQAEEICQYLKERKSIIVNLEYVNKDVARRVIDCVSGAVKVLDGHMQKISNSIFLVAPDNYDINNNVAREEIKSKLSVSWLK
ncbi:MAG: cell division protein SepF [Oscillospiraceae bacterium]|nr:cell division protein SepF [Oscillospiraceae bacterium]